MKKIENYLIVGLGCFFGGILRYFFETLWVPDAGSFPIGTFVADFLGCLIMGLAIGYFAKKKQASATMKLFLTTGFCGGLTTFSSFALEVDKFLMNDLVTMAAYYTVINLVVGMLALFCGMKLIKFFVGK
ncbi:fluoride efflux transporter CrcB [Enterococcus hirae]|uniref:Fluoride-specific ion channel FluC n=1 Tax=Candidatus Enterococcus wittei TaxID=1987383 RepID=A0A242K294_9ENTE|nr:MULTISPECIES: fluoride efflux transporter CrcB [Enterococcus]MBO1117600.1 fluoride efflux transporter CrcB [Enterococcus hirae]OTP11166.1 protein CrcB [Enterococcus sp. 10A9_DIV0425]THE13555.1 fluoride efflux transporter CrcB [Enterococcus hirae]